MRNACKGAALAIANAVAIAFAITLLLSTSRHSRGLWPPHATGMVESITMLALFSSLPLGAAMGVLASKLRSDRLLVLELVALALVPVCGVLTMHAIGVKPSGDELCGLIATASSPTVFAVIALERWTRPRPAHPRALALVPMDSRVGRDAA